MGRLTPQEFTKKYAELPPSLREAYSSIHTDRIIEEIGKKHGLLIDQIGELMNETGYVMLGATPPGDYISKISAATGILREKAREIAIDVNEQVFKPIRDALKQVHNVGGYAHSEKGEQKQSEPFASHQLPVASPKLPVTNSQPPVRTLTDDIQQAANAPVPLPANISEERLTKPFSLPHKEKEYVISEDGKETESPPKHTYQMDPYREPVG